MRSSFDTGLLALMGMAGLRVAALIKLPAGVRVPSSPQVPIAEMLAQKPPEHRRFSALPEFSRY